jgi:chromosome segregation ATPase
VQVVDLQEAVSDLKEALSDLQQLEELKSAAAAAAAEAAGLRAQLGAAQEELEAAHAQLSQVRWVSLQRISGSREGVLLWFSVLQQVKVLRSAVAAAAEEDQVEGLQPQLVAAQEHHQGM